MRIRNLWMAAAVAGIGTIAQADVYRCTDAGGKTIYQESPCANGKQKTVDDSTTRARQREEAQKREDQAALAGDEKLLQACIENKICAAGDYVRLLRNKPKSFVYRALGDPASTQSIGGDEIHYFNVPTNEGRRKARLQITYSILGVDKVNVF